jgi:hypothetical protein
MTHRSPSPCSLPTSACSRRHFLGSALAACSGLSLASISQPRLAAATKPALPGHLDAFVEIKYRRFATHELPAAVRVSEEAGIIASRLVETRVLHEAPVATKRARNLMDGIWDIAGTVTPAGDLLVMFPEGAHYASKTKKLNRMVALRSRDGGATWGPPTVPYDVDYNEHGFIPLIPRGTKRLYSFGTQAIWSRFDPHGPRGEDAPIGFRWSDDDGHTWSPVQIIAPTNDPEFLGMSRTRMCETAMGVWLLGAHAGDWSKKPLVTWQYILRSEDRGATWELLPGPRPGGWQCPGFGRLDETRCLSLGGERVLALSRTPEGRLWQLRSDDAGRTWTDPAPTTLVHPDAPAMLYALDDGRTLMALHHNRSSADKIPMQERAHLFHEHPGMRDRAQIWVSLSRDEGRTWDPPRFLFANATRPTQNNGFFDHNCSYTDAVVTGGNIHFFVPHLWRRALHLKLRRADLEQLPTAETLGV